MTSLIPRPWPHARRLTLAASLLAASMLSTAAAGEADVVSATATPTGTNTWRFDVTVQHDDEGWDHYADAWDVLAPDGTVLGTRTLLHPHVQEQPFTRSLSGVEVPPEVTEVTIRARDSVHDYGGATVVVPLTK